MARPKKPIPETAAPKVVVGSVETAAPPAPQAPETADAVGGVAAPPAASAEPKAKADKAKDSRDDEMAVVVKGPLGGRGRIGKRFGPEPISILISDLTPEEMRALSEDPHLTCVWPEIDF